MKPIELYPYILAPVSKSIIWGGDRLAREYGKTPLPGDSGIAESWELCVHPNGNSIVSNGAHSGVSLAALLELSGGAIVRSGWCGRPFPLLVKLIDARDKLSVQVHPDDAYAQANGEPYGKTEMWYVLEADPGAALVYGLHRDMTRGELAAAVGGGYLEDCLNFVPVKRGDSFFIPAGLIHAIGGGILIAEIQQSSDTTYRVYDYNRPGADGKPRPLHVQQAVECAVTTRTVYTPAGNHTDTSAPLADCPEFIVQRHILSDEAIVPIDASEKFCHLLCVEGAGTLQWSGGAVPLTKGESVYLPAGIGSCALTDECTVLSSSIR